MTSAEQTGNSETSTTNESEANEVKPCHYVFRCGDRAWLCRTCGVDDKKTLLGAVCEPCFRNSDHAKHDVLYTVATGQHGACCACGVVGTWKSEGCCPAHKPRPTNLLKPDGLKVASNEQEPRSRGDEERINISMVDGCERLSLEDLVEDWLGEDADKLKHFRSSAGKSLNLSRKPFGIDSRRSLGVAGAKALAIILQRNTTLTSLKVANNEIGGDAASALAGALKTNGFLVTLDLEGNKIGDDGTKAIAGSLKTNNALKYLHLGDNDIGVEGSCALADAVMTNSTLASLALGVNRIQVLGAKALSNALCYNTTLTSLSLGHGNRIGADGAKALARALENNTSLTSLTITSNDIGLEGAEELARALKINTALTTLFLWSNALNDKAAKALAEGLKYNSTLTSLVLEGNPVSAQGNALCEKLCRRNQVIRDHSAALDSSSASFYISLRHADSKVLLEEEDHPLRWTEDSSGNGAHIWEVAVGDGMAMKLLHNVLQNAIQSDNGSTFDGVLRIPSTEKLREACRHRGALKNLVDFERNHAGSNIVHIAASLESTEALKFCQFLVAIIGADFDGVTDARGRSARDIAIANNNQAMVSWARSVGTMLGRYRVDGGLGAVPVHKSDTCTVRFATDVTKKEHEVGKGVALKIINNRSHFESELRVRLLVGYETIGSGGDIPSEYDRFEEQCTMRLLRYHDEENVLCLVMPKAGRSLDHIIRAERVAGHDLDFIKHFAKIIARALEHLHEKHKIVHGDFKPRNIVRSGSSFKLIDFDASVHIGAPVGTDKISTGYCPPELAILRLTPEESSDDVEKRLSELKRDLKGITSLSGMAWYKEEIKRTEKELQRLKTSNSVHLEAHPTFDIWSFGAVMYQMLTGSTLFKCNNDDNLDGEDDKRRLVEWKGVQKEHLDRVGNCIENCQGATLRDALAANELLNRCLEPNPVDRPQSMTEVTNLPFFSGSKSPLNTINVLFSDPLVYAYDGTIHPFPEGKLNFRRDKDILVRCIQNSKRDINVSFDAATSERLQEVAAKRCSCLHFSGHGHESYLIFEDGFGGTDWISPDDLSKLLPHREPFRFVFVNACHSENIGRAFIAAGVRHVVCCELSSEIRDDAAADFMRSFYGLLMEGDALQLAFDSAKGAVSVKYGDVESDKYILLPQGRDHQVLVFDADHLCDADDCEREKGGRIYHQIPSPPLTFLGREMITFDVLYRILSDKRLVTLFGERGIGLSSLASAVSCYIMDRVTAMVDIDEVVFLSGQRSSCDFCSSFLYPLYQHLLSGGETASDSETALEARALKLLHERKALIVFDCVDSVEKELCNFLRLLFEQTNTGKVLLTAKQRVGFSSSAVIEESVFVGPLHHDSAAELFVQTCSIADTASKRSELRDVLWSKGSLDDDSDLNNAPGTALRAIRDGIPSGIIEAAKDLAYVTFDDFLRSLASH